MRDGQACANCECVKFPLFVVRRWFPPRDVKLWTPPGAEQRVERRPSWTTVRAVCVDRAACRARVEKRTVRARVRAGRIYIATRPGKTEDCERKGHCCWCGEPMWWVNKAGETKLDLRRAYHRAERGERDCRHEVDGSYAFGAREALQMLMRNRARANGYSELRCVDCWTLCSLYVYCPDEGTWTFDMRPPGTWGGAVEFEYWEADHKVELEDGGEHVIGNIECRCGRCHRRKTAESRAARNSRKLPAANLAQMAL